MDFDKPLRRLEGFVIYTTLLDYIDTFVHSYAEQTEGKEFPSLHDATNMILTLLEDFKKIEVSDLKEEKGVDIAEILEILGGRLETVRNNEAKQRAFAEGGQGSFKVGKKAPKQTIQPDLPLEPFLLKTKQDIDWLTSVGITPLNKELITPKKKRKPKNES